MENSFYYFFSAVPQVLAAAMGLFGLFVLFKIQVLKDEILEVSTDLKNTLDILKPIDKENEKKRQNARILLSKAIQIKNIKILRQFFNNEFAYFQLQFDDQVLLLVYGLVQKLNKLYSLHQNLINFTIIISCFSGFIIVGCLSIIPYKCFFLSDRTLLFWIFNIVIGSLALIFLGLIYFLKISLSSSFEIDNKKGIDLD